MQPKGRIIFFADLGHSSPRVPGIFSELARLGWDIDVVCPRVTSRKKDFFISGIEIPKNFNFYFTGLYFSDYKIIIGSGLIKRLTRLITKLILKFGIFLWSRLLFCRQDLGWHSGVENHKYWVPWAVKRATKLHRDTPHNSRIPTVVLSSSSPFTAHIAASKFSSEMHLPWIADYRDLWTLNHSRHQDLHDPMSIFEREIISVASEIVTVSEQLKGQQSSLFNGEITVIHNGFAKRKLASRVAPTKPLKIVYTGSLYKDNMNLDLFLNALDKFNGRFIEPKIQVVFAGTVSTEVRNYYSQKNLLLPDYISVLGDLSRDRAYRLQQDADIGLVLGWEDKAFQGSFPTKFFEYIGSNLYVLFTGGHEGDECASMISKAGLGSVAHDHNRLTEVFQELVENPGKLVQNSRNCEEFSYGSIARKFDLVLSNYCIPKTNYFS